jgi:hypothetical protein
MTIEWISNAFFLTVKYFRDFNFEFIISPDSRKLFNSSTVISTQYVTIQVVDKSWNYQLSKPHTRAF